MDAFNAKDFYGHSLSEDPKLRTTTRNYEFKFNSSEHLERIINRVKMGREQKRQTDLLAQSRFFPTINKLCAPFPRDKSSPFFHGASVETQFEKSSSRGAVVKVMSDDEIEAMIAQAIQTTPGVPVTSGTSETNTSLSGNTSVIPETKSQDVSINVLRIEAKVPKCSVEFQSVLQPQWVEIKPTQKANAYIFHVPSSSLLEESVVSDNVSAINLANESRENDEIEKSDKIIEDKFGDVISNDSTMSEDYIIRTENLDHQGDGESSADSPLSFGIESPLNECERAEMERVFRKALPHVPEMEFGNLESQAESVSSDEQNEDKDEDVQDTSSEIVERQFQPIVRINQQEPCHKKKPQSVPSTGRSMPKTPKSTQHTPKSQRSPISSRPPKSPKVQKKLSSKKKTNILLDQKMTKQVEVLKHEKIRIFSKMTSIQEKIIQTLDGLRMSILELTLPDGQVERKNRERNAFEFSVRFSRNYLFTLERMIEEIQNTPKQDFRSATANRACIKVCGLYGLLEQALKCYHKQLRHFFIDSAPKKLDILICMINDTTIICLNKKIFDKQDSLIQCLLARCNLFLEFLAIFTEQKDSQKSVREVPLKLPKTSSKWDLTMNLNNLNMYEPKLVPKKLKKKTRKQTFKSKEKVKEQRKIPHSMMTKVSDRISLPAPDPVDTQVQKVNNSESLQLINTAIEEQPESDLTKTVIETLQDITKDEVRQMLGPLALNLDTILKCPDNPQSVESMLSILNSQLLKKCKQLKVDVAATENSTQNGNTYQKEMTKKGADSSKGGRRKENRQKRKQECKTNATSSSNSVNKGSTEQTERLNSTATICDKQSLSNVDDVAVLDSRSTIRRGGAFVSSAKLVTANKPTHTPAAIEIGIPPPSLAISAVQLDEVILPPPQTPETPMKRMTLQRGEYSNNPPAVVASADKSARECQGTGDGGYPKGYRKEISTKRKMKDGAANAFGGGTKDDQGAWQPNPPSSPPAENEARKSGQMEQLKYSSNALYTFVKFNEEEIPALEVQGATNELEDIPEEECFISSKTKLILLSPKPVQYTSTKSLLESNRNLAFSSPKNVNEETINQDDVKPLQDQRTNFIELCKENPLYTNPQFPQPWKVLSKISDNIAREIVGDFENDLSFGEESYVQDFINMEMRT